MTRAHCAPPTPAAQADVSLASTGGRRTAVRTAYLVSTYPALSQAFLEREVLALRAAGVEVHTVAVRPTPAVELRSDTARVEAAATPVLLAAGRAEWAAAARAVSRAPGGVRALAATLRSALATGPAEPRARLWQAFYLAEAVQLVHRMRTLGLRHVHVHFANNAADIARLAVRLGQAGDPDGLPWSWSMSMHGPTELADVTRFDLAAKVRSAAFVACITDFCRSQLMMLVPPAHWPALRLVRMAVDPDRYPPRAAERERRPPGPLRVLCVGRLVPEKAQALLLDAVDSLRHNAVEVELVLAGRGPSREDLLARAAALGLSGRVRVEGEVGQDELPAWYAWADVLALPSFAEGLPVVLMEAMASELPVLTTRIAGIPELVEDGVTGLLATPGRPDLLADALARLATDPSLRHRLGRAGRQRVLRDHLPGPNAAALAALLARAPGVSGRR